VWELLRVIRLAPADWAALFIAATALLRARVRFGRISARQLVEELKVDAGAQTPAPLDLIQTARVTRLSWAIRMAAACVPWRADCLIQVIAADSLLRKRGLTPSFHLGVAKEVGGRLAAHAWLTCGDVIVNSGSVERFSVIIGPADEQP
jgi:hypothetical protein